MLNSDEHSLYCRPAGLSDSESDSDTDFCFEDPTKNRYSLSNEWNITRTVQERFQSNVIQGNRNDFENIIHDELNDAVDFRFPNNWTPLMYTCYHGKPDMADYLLDRGADPNAHCDSTTPLLLLCTNGFGTDEQLRRIAQKLIEKGAILNLGDRQGITPLMRAIQCGRLDLFELFIENNANIEMRDQQGWTAIFWAVHCNHTTTLERLIALGARVIEVDRANRTLIDIAESHDNSVNVKLLEPYFQSYVSEEPIFESQSPNYWLEYYPGLRKNHNELYKDEISNLLYAMNCDDLKPLILNSGIDLRTFLLLEDKDMIRLGIDLEFERQRLRQGLRNFHTRNWKLKSVPGLYSIQDRNYSLCECLEAAATNLLHFYTMEASLQYTIREFNKFRKQLKTQSDSTKLDINQYISKMKTNIRDIKKEMGRMQESLIVIRNNNPELIQMEEVQSPEEITSLQASTILALTCGFGYITLRGIRWGVSLLLRK